MTRVFIHLLGFMEEEAGLRPEDLPELMARERQSQDCTGPPVPES